jgi:hypothetical protein
MLDYRVAGSQVTVLHHRTGVMHPPAISPAPRILARRDGRAAQRADHTRSVCLVVVPRRTGLIVLRGVFWPRSAQVFQQPLLNLATSEIRWSCHGASRKRDVVKLLITSVAPQRSPERNFMLRLTLCWLLFL